MKVVTCTNQKGGVAKTTTVLMLAQCLANKGKKVLCIDLDPQDGNLSSRMGADKKEVCGTFEIFDDPETQPDDVLQTIDISDKVSIDVIAASRELQKFSGAQDSVDAYFVLQEFIEKLPEDAYDYVIIDTPPALSNLTINALTATDYVLVPSKAETSSAEGIVELSNTVAKIKSRFNSKIEVLGILITFYKANTVVQQECREGICKIADKIGTDVFKSSIRNSVVIQEAQESLVPVYSYKRTSAATHDCLDFAAEFEKRIKKFEKQKNK